MRILFVNQYGPGDAAPTARLLDELAEYLRERGHGVEFIFQRQSYHGRPSGGGSRLRRELTAAGAILWEGAMRKLAKVDIVFSLSSPPGLLPVAALVAWRRRAALVHWAMDLYPELAVALGEIKSTSLLRRMVGGAMGWAYRRTGLTVALDEDMRRHLQIIYGIESQVLPPWPPRSTERSDILPASPGSAEWTWLYSGNLGRAHEWQTLLEAQRLLEVRGLPIHLKFRGDGAARAAARDYAGQIGLMQCHWEGYVEENAVVSALLAAQALIVTQRPETRGLLWPSKLALLLRLPRPIVWVGSTTGAIAEQLAARGNAGVFAPGQAEPLADYIESLHVQPNSCTDVPSMPGSIEGCAKFEGWLSQVLSMRVPFEH